MDVYMGEPSPPTAPETPSPKQSQMRPCKKKVSDVNLLHLHESENSKNATCSYRYKGKKILKSSYLNDVDVKKVEEAVKVNSPHQHRKISELGESEREQSVQRPDDSDSERNVLAQSSLHGSYLEDEKENIPVGAILASPFTLSKLKNPEFIQEDRNL